MFLILLLMAFVILLVEKRQSETIAEESRKRGVSIARNLAAVSTNALLTYNYVVLVQNAERVALEEDVVYVIIHDKESNVAAYSRHGDKQGTLLRDDVTRKALATREPMIQPAFFEEKKIPILDISIPVYIKESEEKWGTVRIGLSLAGMKSQILRTRLHLLLLGLCAIALGILGSIVFSRRITHPISTLVESTVAAARGNLDQTIDLRTGDEIEELGRNFHHMIQEIRFQRTELEHRLHEITELKAYADNVLSSMTNGLITIDLHKRIVTINKMAERVLKRGGEEIRGHLMEEALGSSHPFCQMMSETLSLAKGIFHSEIEFRANEGSLWFAASTSLLTGEGGKAMGALIIFEDMTELKILEERLRQADRLAALGTLSAGLAHEIKNPLSAIKTFVQLLPKKFQNQPFMEKFNVTVPREIDRINYLVEDLLELTRKRKRTFVSLDVNLLITQVIDLHGEELRRKQIIFENQLDRNIPLVGGDSDALYRAFSNVVINSIQAMPTGGSLMISAEKDQVCPTVKITFKDTGIGMEEETAKNLFNPFFTTKDKGTGLGMALAHKIVEDHQGVIEVASQKGKGTVVTLFLPVAKMSSCL